MIDIATIQIGDASIAVSVQSDQLIRLHMAGILSLPITATIAAELRDALSRAIVASGRTEVQIHADAIVMALRHQLGLLDEIKKRSPAEVQRVYEFLAAHSRSACPAATMTGEVP